MTLSVFAPPVEAVPGTPSRAVVRVTNDGSAPVQASIAVAGIEPAWLVVPAALGPIPPGQSVEAEIQVQIPAGHPACELVGALTARASDAGEVTRADLLVSVLDGSVVSALLDPPDVRGGRRGRAELVLRNRGRSPLRVDVESSSPDQELRVRFKDPTRVVQAGQEVRVPARFSALRPLFGSPRRRPFIVSVRTRGTPVHLDGAFTQRPLLASWMTKTIAVAAVVAVWVAVAVVGISSLSKHVNKTAQQQAVNNAPPVTAPPGPSAANPATPAGGGGPSGSGTGGSGGSGSGSAGGAATTATAAAAPSRVSGKVAAAQPGGVTVTLQPTSVSDAPPQVTTVSSAPRSDIVLAAATIKAPLTKLFGADLPPARTVAPLSAPSSGPAVSSYSTVTSPDGFWAFASVPPGTYTVSFSKPGYAVASYVVDVTGKGQAITLPSRLVPGNGSASGTVQGPNGPLGGVQLTITDGTVTLMTRTPTVGTVGSWAVNGLSTPGTYLVTATDPGFSNQTTLFTLAASGRATGLKLTMVPGAGSLSGKVLSSRDGQPVGGLTVTATNGSVTRTTTTTTTGAIGTYSLPDLPVPGTYALTISGPGFVTQTEQALLGSDPSTDNATVNATVTTSGADVTGVATGPNGQGLPGAGAILSNQKNVFKTLTTSSGTVGSFDFGQVPPGSYVLSVEDFGYATKSAQVTVGSGQVQTVNLSLPVATDMSLATATIQGSILSLLTSKPVIGARISIDGQAGSVTTDANGAYSISNVDPGTHTITASCPAANPCQSLDLSTNKLAPSDFETTTVQVSVALGAVDFAPQILMPKLDQLAGIVVDGTGARVPNPKVTLTSTASGISYSANPNPAASGVTAAQGGFEFDNLPSGTYTMTVSGPPPPAGSGSCSGVEQYKPLTTSINLQVDTDYLLNGAPGTANASPLLNVLPQYRVNTVVAAQGSKPAPTPGVQVDVKSTTPGVSFDQICTETTTQPVVALPVSDIGDSFVASFSYTSGATTYTAPDSAPFTAEYNNASIDSALLVPPSPGTSVTMSFPWRMPSGTVSCQVTTTAISPCPALTDPGDIPTVTLTGSVVQPGGTTAPATFTASPNAASGVWTFTPSSLSGLVPGTVSFTVSGGAFQTFTANANTSSSGFGTQAFALAPNLSTVQGTLSAPVANTAIQVSPPDSSLNVSPATASPTDNIIWQQSGQPTGQAFPGDYSVTFSRAGYDSAVVNGFEVPLCDSTCTATLGEGAQLSVHPDVLTYSAGTGSVTLDAHMTLQVTPSFTPIPGVAYPTVTVTSFWGTVVGSQQLSATSASATFSDLSATGNPYTVTVAGPDFATSVTTAPALPAQSSTAKVPYTPTLTPLGYLTGLVQGLINKSPGSLAHATVTATLVSANGCSAATPSPISGTTLADGTFSLTNSDPNYPGLCVGATYSVAVTAPTGYAPAAAPYSVTIAPGDNAVNGGNPIQLQAQQISQTILVTDGANPLPGVQVSASSAIGAPVSGTTADGSGATPKGELTLSLDPTTYTLSFQISEYLPSSETVTYTVGETTKSVVDTAPLLTVALSIDKNTIYGVVSTPGTCGASSGACPLAGATVTLLDHTGTTIDTTTSSATGAYSFPTTTGPIIPNGTYSVDAALAGWQYSSSYQPGLVTSPSLSTVKNVSLVPVPVGLNVTVTSNLPSISLSGYTLSLAPASPPSGLSLACTAAPGAPALPATGEGNSQNASVAFSGGSYVATFPSVVPDYYTLTVQGSGLPAQADDALVVCPGGNVAEYAPAPTAATASTATAAYTTAGAATFQAMAGQITGSVAVSDNSKILASALSVHLAPHTGSIGTHDTVFATCSNPSCTQGTFTSGLLALDSTYDVTADAPSGYSNSVTDGPVTLSSSGPTSLSGGPLTVAPMPVEVQVTINDASTGKGVNGLDLTLTDTTISGDASLQTVYGTAGLNDPIGPYTATTQTATVSATSVDGVATFSQVIPDPNGTYALTAKWNGQSVNLVSGSSSVASLPVTVSIGSNNTGQTIGADYTGSITGTVYDANASTPAVYLCLAPATTCTSSNANQTKSVTVTSTGTATYTFSSVAPGSYVIGSDITGSTTTAITLPPGGAPAGPTFIAPGGITGTVQGAVGDTVTVYLCSTSSCSASTELQSDPVTIPGHAGTSGSAPYSFTNLPVTAPAGQAYYLSSSLSSSTTTTITVTPGVTDPNGPTYEEPGAITGTVNGATANPTVDLCTDSTCTSPTPQTVTMSGGTGTYTFTGRTPGSYWVTSPGNYVGGTPSAPQKVTVSSGLTAKGPTYDEAATITATVNGTTATSVYLCTSSSSCTSSTGTPGPVNITSPATSGTYSFTGRAPGTYYVISPGNYVGGTSTPGSTPQPVTVSAGATSSVTFDEPVTISGTVQDVANKTDTVTVCPTDTTSCNSTGKSTPVAIDSSGNGTFTFTLPPQASDYYVSATLTTGTTTTQPEPATPGSQTTGVSFTATGAIPVSVTGITTKSTDSVKVCVTTTNCQTFTANGSYTFPGLAPGSYTVNATASPTGSTVTPATTSVTLTAGETATSIGLKFG